MDFARACQFIPKHRALRRCAEPDHRGGGFFRETRHRSSGKLLQSDWLLPFPEQQRQLCLLLQKALDIDLQSDDCRLISNSMYLYGTCFRNTDRNKALEIYKEANNIAYKNNIRQKYDAEIGQLFYELKDYDSALYYTNRALQNYDNKNPYNDNLRNIYRTLFKAYLAKTITRKPQHTQINVFQYSTKTGKKKKSESPSRITARKLKTRTNYMRKSQTCHVCHFCGFFRCHCAGFCSFLPEDHEAEESERLSALQLAMEQKQNVQDNWLANNKVYRKAISLDKGIADKSLVLSDSDWKEFVNITNIVHDGFVLKIKELNPSLTENDIEACCCSRYGFSDKTIAALCGIEVRSFKRHRQRIMEKLGGEKNFHEMMKEL